MKVLKNILFILILVLLFLPGIQKTIKLFDLKPLMGSFEMKEMPVFSFREYISGPYQDRYNQYTEEHIGFRPWLVRLNNQIAYSFFGIAQANQVVIGKNRYLFEENYIKAYKGTDFQGSSTWDPKIKKLKLIADQLKKVNTELIVVFAPGKGTFFPEYIPDRYNPEQRDTTNYDYLLNACREHGIEHIDFNGWFSSLKDTSSYPLYPQCGIHWSYYGSALALDSLIGYMEHLGSKKMLDFGWSDIEMSDNLRDPDYDIADGMNLLFKIRCYDMAYPKLYFKEDSITFKPSVITIADSYYWIFHGKGITQRIYENDNFWYYYQEAHGDRYKEDRNLQNINRLEEFKKADYIVILVTDANLYKFAFGFIDDAYSLLSDLPDGSEPDEALIGQYIKTIRNNPEWYKSIEEKAKINEISVEEMLRRDAIWLINQESNK